MPKCIILRGLPGSGKSTLAKGYEAIGYTVVSADKYFIRDGVYVYNKHKIGEAHAAAKRSFRIAIYLSENITVDNTNLAKFEWEYYSDLALQQGYTVRIINVGTTLTDEELAKRNIHGVPKEVIARMRKKMETYDYQVERLNANL